MTPTDRLFLDGWTAATRNLASSIQAQGKPASRRVAAYHATSIFRVTLNDLWPWYYGWAMANASAFSVWEQDIAL